MNAAPRLMTAREIEDEYGIPPNRLKQWVHREHLSPELRGQRPHLYREDDLLRCIAARRHATQSRVLAG